MVDIALVSLLIVAVLLVAERIGAWYLSIPMVLVAAGAILGQHGLGWIDIGPDKELALELTELTLGLLLFADASTLNLRSVLQEADLEARLLSVGLLLTVVFGTALAYFIFDNATFGLALLIGAALAPTDIALGLPIVNNESIPSRIRQALNVESGLNDGIVTPIVAVAITLAISEAESSNSGWVTDAFKEVAIAVALAVVVGAIGGILLRESLARGWTSREYGELIFFGLAIAIFFGARKLEGNSFIAAFVGGMVTAAMLGPKSEEVYEFTETAGSGLANFVWLVFGAMVVPLAVDDFFSWRAVGFAILALTVMRMIPVAISLLGFGLRRDTVGIMGWFGPRGMASVVFLITAFVAFEEAHAPVDTLVGAMGWTILLSVFLHGLTATPLGNWYGKRLEHADHSIPEFQGPTAIEEATAVA